MFLTYARIATRRIATRLTLVGIVDGLLDLVPGGEKRRIRQSLLIDNGVASCLLRHGDGNAWIVEIAAEESGSVIEVLDGLKTRFKQNHMRRPIKPVRGSGMLDGRRKSNIWTAQVVLISPNTSIVVLTEDMYDNLDINAKSLWKGYEYVMTYETWDEEAISEGETDDKGWETEKSDKYDSLEELLNDSEITNHYWEGWSSSHPGPLDWLNSEDEEDYQTDKNTRYGLFVRRVDKKPLSSAEIDYISQALL